LRQCPDRDAFRAGRNLPDKEFRYLRTVIVTAAVYRGFGSELAPLPLTFRHWAGITPYTSACALSRELWFCYPVARAWTLRLPRAPPVRASRYAQHPFFRRYGVNLPSSLTRDHSSTLVSSTSLPVSVCGTGVGNLPSRPFLAVQVPRPWPWVPPWPRHRLSVIDNGDLPPLPPYRLTRRSSRRGDSPSAFGIGQTISQRYRNINRLSIGFASRLRLRPDSPAVVYPCGGTLRLAVVGVATPLLCYSFRHSHS
jgi:hypothetical protein